MTMRSIKFKFVASIVVLLLTMLYVYCVYFLPFSYDKLNANAVKKIQVRNHLNGHEYELNRSGIEMLLAVLNNSRRQFQFLPVFYKPVMLPDVVLEIEDDESSHYFRCNYHGPNRVAIVYCNTGATIYANRLDFENAIAFSEE